MTAFTAPDDVDPVLLFVATLTPSQRAVLCQVARAGYLHLDLLTDPQRAVASGLAASDMGLLYRTSGVDVVALPHDLRLSPSHGYILSPLGAQVVACFTQEGG